MIYGKIYLDEDENGAALLVFEAAKQEDRNEIYLSHAKNVYDKSGRLRFSSPLTCIYGAPLVAIGHRAKAVLAARLADASSYDLSREGGDLEFRGRHDDDRIPSFLDPAFHYYLWTGFGQIHLVFAA